MSFFGLFKSGKDLAQPIDAVGNTFDKLFTSDEERAQAAFVMAQLKAQPHILQAELAKLEAQHRSAFVAGARPFILWVCGVALAQYFVINPWLDALFDIELTVDASALINLVLALIGLGGLRTAEKIKGVAK